MPSKERGLGAWLSFRREKVPGTAPIASPDTTKQAAGMPSAWSQSSHTLLATAPMVRRWTVGEMIPYLI